MNKNWLILTKNKTAIESLQQSLQVNETICTLLTQRGFTDFEKAKQYFRPQLSFLPDPYLMKDMAKAVSRITKAIECKEKILVFGDYDVDGTTSVAMMYQFLCTIYDEAYIDFYIPHRYREGYGISKMGIDFAAENNFTLIVSLDCGIKSVDLIGYANTLKIDFIVCDHHLPDAILPPAFAILNPKQVDCNYPYKELCGCGVGFKLITAIASNLKLNQSSYSCYLDLVATAIAADIVPITGENRILAYYGLMQINESPCQGIKALIKLGGIQGKLSINNVVFVIAPRINAAGRMDDAKKAVQLFIEKNEANALVIAALLHNDNTDRKVADSSITEAALAMIESDPSSSTKKTTVVYNEHWHKGVVGIVASRLIEKHYKPTVVLTKSGDVVAGSARSVVGFNLYEAIYACRNHLLGYGGHFAAAGMTMLPEEVEPFAISFEKEVAATIPEKLLVPEIIIDTEISFKEITDTLYAMLCQMEPFGPENMRPVFITKGVQNTNFSKIVKEQHIRFSITHQGKTLSGIGFNMAEKFHLLTQKKPIDIVYTIDENEWNNNKTLQLKVIDFKESLDE
jgi:single-stranded-DNA-specific exonuclease